jgi:NAD+ diphosphatase
MNIISLTKIQKRWITNMKYCTECGEKLTIRYLKNEGDIPYCPKCEQYRFPMFNAAVSMIVIDTTNQKILLIQQYGRPYYILVAGYINRTENAEHAAAREVLEETGLNVSRLRFNRSHFFEPSNTLMLNFTCFVDDISTFSPNEEIDSSAWFTFEEARKNIKSDSLAQEFLWAYLDENA